MFLFFIQIFLSTLKFFSHNTSLKRNNELLSVTKSLSISFIAYSKDQNL